MTTKTYQLINSLSLRTCVTVAGKQIGIRFEGGTCDGSGRIIRHGALTTSDSELQQAIEADVLYGKRFTLCGDPNTEPHTDLHTGDGTGDLSNDKEQVLDVTNAQTAIEWLKTHKGVEFKERPKADEVKAKAAERGVVFVDWK